MDLAREAAPEIDRLVLSVNAHTSARYDDELLALAAERGLESLELLPHFADFLLAGVLTPRLAKLRMRYFPPERIDARFDELESNGLIERRGEQLLATERMREVLEAMLSARAQAAGELWRDHVGEVDVATTHARKVSEAASPDHEVAVAHRAAPESDDPYLRLHTLLTNLRYIRQHDHVEAWSSQGLTPRAMVIMTALWKGSDVESTAEGLEDLMEAGFATRDPTGLTPEGRALRDAIEDAGRPSSVGTVEEPSETSSRIRLSSCKRRTV